MAAITPRFLFLLIRKLFPGLAWKCWLSGDDVAQTHSPDCNAVRRRSMHSLPANRK